MLDNGSGPSTLLHSSDVCGGKNLTKRRIFTRDVLSISAIERNTVHIDRRPEHDIRAFCEVLFADSFGPLPSCIRIPSGRDRQCARPRSYLPDHPCVCSPKALHSVLHVDRRQSQPWIRQNITDVVSLLLRPSPPAGAVNQPMLLLKRHVVHQLRCPTSGAAWLRPIWRRRSGRSFILAISRRQRCASWEQDEHNADQDSKNDCRDHNALAIAPLAARRRATIVRMPTLVIIARDTLI
mmetsp:Transcript_22449/g.76908  ORF Transcript_22449/g.76908 Transcript_22449/m.76908 type:complete len:238 (+) Transcript_22449:1854-2567(+)